MLYIYVQCHGTSGILIVVATSEAEARELMRGTYTYTRAAPVTQHEIKDGLLIENYGDA